MGDLTRALDDLRAGARTSDAVNALFAAAYQDLKRMARERLRQSRPITTIDTTGLVHESYLRFINADRLELQDRNHFMMYAAKVMRSVLVDLARRGGAARRGGDDVRVTLATDIPDGTAAHAEVIAIDDALSALASVDPQLVQLVELRYFAGLTIEEVAELLETSPRTVFRQWEKARLMLFDALRGE